MKKLYLTKKKIYKENRKALVNDAPKFLAESFNGVVIQVDGEFIHES